MSEENLKHKTKVGIYWTFLNQGATYIMYFVVGIVMARILTPEDYGITALPNVFINVAALLMTSGFGTALIRKPEVTEKDLSTAFFYSLGMGFLMYIILFLAAPFIAVFYNTPILTPLIRVTAISFLWGALNTVQNVILSRNLDFKSRTYITLSSQVFASAAGIIAAYQGYGMWAIIISNLVSSILITIFTWLKVKWYPKEKFDKLSFKYLWNFGNKLIGADLINTLYQNITPVFVGKYYSPTDLGIYNRADGYSSLPANQISGVLGNVSFPVLSKLQDDKNVLRESYRRMVKVACFIAFPVFMMLCALARPLVITMITEKWESCIILLQIMCFGKMWWPIQSLNVSLLHVSGRSDLFLKVEAYKKSILLIILCVSLPWGMIIFCSAQILQNMVGLYINTYYTKDLIDLSLWKQLKDIFPSLLLSTILFISVLATIHFIDNYIMQLFIGLLVGCTIYLGGAILFKFDELNDVKYMLNRK